MALGRDLSFTSADWPIILQTSPRTRYIPKNLLRPVIVIWIHIDKGNRFGEIRMIKHIAILRVISGELGHLLITFVCLSAMKIVFWPDNQKKLTNKCHNSTASGIFSLQNICDRLLECLLTEVTRNTRTYPRYNVYCLIIVFQQSITPSHWIKSFEKISVWSF